MARGQYITETLSTTYISFDMIFIQIMGIPIDPYKMIMSWIY